MAALLPDFFLYLKDNMNTQEKLIDLIHDFDNAMLVTKGDDGSLDARPMAVAKATDTGEIWFVSDRNSGKVADLMLDHDVAVTMQSDRKFVTPFPANVVSSTIKR